MATMIRPREGRMIAGVCAAVGRRYGYSANTVRLLTLLLALLPGPMFLLYLILWITLPSE